MGGFSVPQTSTLVGLALPTFVGYLYIETCLVFFLGVEGNANLI
eukprot:NODE_7292_length_241_cov_14.015625_g7209_i0.p2 GENE.NODE_7292_length_241_cov_14.015625_g7209_i0~~NODE_7292_length_241_cov_14.015625_g7209_i0.p2  ORF type:complete len:54 (+),score=20.45 NODE_7292_length_241_cov_14.015625_g7209_i0:31-162(+)